MLCWKNAGGARREIRESERDSSENYLSSGTHVLPHQLLPLRSPLQDGATSGQRPARPHRTFQCFSRSLLPSLIRATFLAAGSRKHVAEGSSLLEIVEARESEDQEGCRSSGAMEKGCEGSAKKTYSVSHADYQLLEEVGSGGTATAFRALYIPRNEIVAIKCLDLERYDSNLDDIRREVQMMCLLDHPNVVKGYCSFVVGHSLWVVMPFMTEGSCLHLMKIAYPEGFEELVIGSLLKETLKALVYLHKHGHIHRDVKAGNILLDTFGTVKLADFGVTAYMFDKGARLRSRNTFVGTPCWMAPEVLQPGGGYDSKADIWSFGITALELAHGHAPFSKYPPMKVLLMTLQNAPPGLDYDRDKKFSKSFKEIVAMCLVKDPKKRPTAEELLKHSFFKNAKPPELYVKGLLSGLPPLWDRVKALQLKDAAKLALKKMASSDQEALSQSEYQRGVSAWNFDMEDLKAQASLIQDDDEVFVETKVDGSFSNDINDKETSRLRSNSGDSSVIDEITYRTEGGSQLPRHGAQNPPNLSDPLILSNCVSKNSLSAPMQYLGCGNSSEDNSGANFVQMKGRFSVTFENVDLGQDVTIRSVSQKSSQDSLRRRSASVGDLIVSPKQLVRAGASEREHLLVEILGLQARMIILNNELTEEKLKCIELQQTLSAFGSEEHKREDGAEKA